MHASPTERERVLAAVRNSVSRADAAGKVVGVASKAVALRATIAREVQRELVRPVAELFLPQYRSSHGTNGFVSIQSDPFAEEDAGAIIEAAHADRALSPNIIAKIPVTASGLEAIETLVAEDVPIIATEVMSIAQVVAACETYRRAAARSGRQPPLYVTHITGIFDEHLAAAVRDGGIDIAPDVLWAAGIAVARKQFRVMRERGYPGIVLGGGARGLHHFTELVGENAHVTINWAGTADELIRTNPVVVSRAGSPVPDFVIDELLGKLEDFRKAYSSDGLRVEEFKDFGPVARFRKSFEEGWETLLSLAGEGV